MSNESKHTPGPWTLDQYGNIRDGKGVQVTASGLAMAAGYRPKDDVAFINTRLIAAAPELLEALEMAVESIGTTAAADAGRLGASPERISEHVAAATAPYRAAIAKAKGQ